MDARSKGFTTKLVHAGILDEPSWGCRGKPDDQRQSAEDTHKHGCMVCGEELAYLVFPRENTCHYCGRIQPSDAQCAAGHFVCDVCHSAGALEIITQVCRYTEKRDAVAIMQAIRSHPGFHMHGPEHHALIPAVILAALRNNGHTVPDDWIVAAIRRGQAIQGGACAFLGACGAAVGVGIAVSLLLEANPCDGSKRQAAQRATQRALGRIASFDAPRCCQRDSWLALQEASGFLQENHGMGLIVDHRIICAQIHRNKECIRDGCPLWPHRVDQAAISTTEKMTS